MGPDIVPEFTSKEFRHMWITLAQASWLLTPVHSERWVLTYILGRTLRFKKLHEFIPLSDFLQGSPHTDHHLPWGLGYSRAQIHKARRGLERRNLVDIGGASVVLYRLNLPGILACLIKVAEHLDDTINTDQFKALRAKAIGIYRAQDWSSGEVVPAEGSMKKIENGLKHGREISEKARRKKVAKAIKEQTIGWIKAKMAEWAEEFDLKFEDTWTGREGKSAQRWMKYCEEEDVNPQEHLFLVVKHWSSIKMRLEHLNQPHRRYISSIVSFSQYFNNRRAIDKIIVEIQGEPEPQPVEVITIDEWKERKAAEAEAEEG